METDAEFLLTSFHKPSTSFGLLIEDINTMFLGFQDVMFRHIRRKANIVAHLLARYAFSHIASVTWIDSSPLFISSTVTSDLSSY